MIVNYIVSCSICALMVLIFLICYFRSKGKYDEYLEYVDKEEYGLKDFIPLGWVIYEMDLASKLPMGIRTILARQDNNNYQKILELRGVRDAEFYTFLHNGYRICLGLVAGTFASILGLIMTSQGSNDGKILSLVALVLMFAMPFAADSTLNGQIGKRRLAIQMEFPEFINKLTLLVNAGMTISKAWAKIINETKKEHILYDEMKFAFADIQAGKPEPQAYEEFARRCHVKEVTKFVSVVVMNLKRGGSEVVPILKQQGDECWEMRKNAARTLGEEAGTKILIPMMIMFMGIVLIVACPAVLSMTAGM